MAETVLQMVTKKERESVGGEGDGVREIGFR